MGGEQQVPPLRSPGFPVKLGGVGALHAPFPYRKAHTRPCPILRARKSGYASVGMTHLFGWKNISKIGPLNRRSLGFARDDKGEGSASIESGF
jgi:hypothetical protein